MADGTTPNRVTRGIPFTVQNIVFPSFDLGISQQQHNVVAASADKMVERRSKNIHDPRRVPNPPIAKSSKKIDAATVTKRKKLPMLFDKGKQVVEVNEEEQLPAKKQVRKRNVVIPRLHFDLVDSGRYKDYTWGKEAFVDLIKSIHNKMDKPKQYYCLRGFPFAIQAWVYECCSNVDPDLAVRNGDRIPRILNWKTVDPTPSFNHLMTGMFTDDVSEDHVTYNNIVPVMSEVETLGLRPYLSNRTAATTNTHEVVDDYDDFSSTPPHLAATKQPQKKDVSKSPLHKKPRQMRAVPPTV
ncbi:uncharacterized protein LOC132063150 [Lycium ferocissimum]|uniref:uncharacterized protein LOC132063150 n=1 Tax=Lycium ferocissimum TaxID=112874 RepID=UPI0028164DD3|nr:uncharacterized protein LOC132063150 [Lycium ferocissimum]